MRAYAQHYLGLIAGKLEPRVGRDPFFKIGMGALTLLALLSWLQVIIFGHQSSFTRGVLSVGFVIFVLVLVRSIRGLRSSERALVKAEAASKKANEEYEQAVARRKQAEAEAKERGGAYVGDLNATDATSLSLWLEHNSEEPVGIFFEAGRLRFARASSDDLLLPSEVD